ncbi:DUF1826 domain-containing protein [Lacimonas salitolerans]|uniref:DUF1826 domain-containing protein n=1 Tax=Lacimonas salitolerans TaxID=1323750 RepID=A0ABW4EFZ6_9RHOB
MSVAEVARTPMLPGLAVTDTPEGLSLIRRADAAAAIWTRAPLPAFQRWLDDLPSDQLPRGRVILRPHAVPDMLTALCEQVGTPPGPHRQRLIEDIVALSDIFATTMGAQVLQLRLDVVGTDACRKFHVDMLRARLICTYRGPGTQYGLARQGNDPAQIHDLPTGSAMVMRGRLWPPQPDTGFVHRSPPIAGTGQVRLVLVLDPVDDPDDQP